MTLEAKKKADSKSDYRILIKRKRKSVDIYVYLPPYHRLQLVYLSSHQQKCENSSEKNGTPFSQIWNIQSFQIQRFPYNQ